jgi:hypothetical protein
LLCGYHNFNTSKSKQKIQRQITADPEDSGEQKNDDPVSVIHKATSPSSIIRPPPPLSMPGTPDPAPSPSLSNHGF